jgi:hypothetical protein
MKFKDIHKKTKVMLYKTLTRTVLTYGRENWTLSKKSENALSIFERKILRRIYGPVKDNGHWRIRYNKELYELHGEPDLVTCIKLKRLQWAGHVQRMEGTRIAKKAFKAKFGEVRSVGKPRKRWEDVVQQDAARFLRSGNWKLAANDKNIVETEDIGGQGPILAVAPSDGIYYYWKEVFNSLRSDVLQCYSKTPQDYGCKAQG